MKVAAMILTGKAEVHVFNHRLEQERKISLPTVPLSMITLPDLDGDVARELIYIDHKFSILLDSEYGIKAPSALIAPTCGNS
jgi:hypothetical protein